MDNDFMSRLPRDLFSMFILLILLKKKNTKVLNERIANRAEK